MSWFEQVRELTLARIGPELGMERRGHRWSPCPACGSDRTRTDPRPPLLDVNGGRGWECYACGEKGSALDALCYRLFDTALSKGDPRWADLRAFCSARGWCEGAADRVVPRVQPRAPLRTPPEARREWPPWQEVHALWASALPLSSDRDAVAWVARRFGTDPATLDELEAARVLPTDDLPQWARFRGVGWRERGYRLVVPLHDARGRLRSLRARYVAPGKPDGPKTLPPTGFKVSGLVMACARGRVLLRDGAMDAGREVWIVEGEPKFLGCLVHNRPSTPVLGIFNGAWSDEHAARIPDGLTVTLLTDADEQGDKYADQVRESLAQRCTVRRWHPLPIPPEATHGPQNVHGPGHRGSA